MPYLITPVDENGRVMADVLGQLCEHLIAQGIHGLTPLGSTGEYAYLNEEQRIDAVKTTIKATRGRVPVIAGVAAIATTEAIKQARTYEQLGVDGILLVLDIYFPLTESQIETYFSSVADAVDLPIVIYTNPTFQRSNLSIDSICRLSKHPNIVGLKDASTNTGRLLSIMNRCGSDIDVFAASSHIPLCVMMMGGKGWLAGPACLVPRQSVALYNACMKQDWPHAVELQRSLWGVNEVFSSMSLAACVKAGLQEQGFRVGDPVPPQHPVSSSERDRIIRALASI